MDVKKKVLFILHIPPPVNGAAIMGQYVRNSEAINQKFKTDYINLTTSFALEKIGRGGFYKVRVVFKILWITLKALWKKPYDLCYVSLTAKGVGFYKDLLVVCVLKLFKQNIIYHFHNKGVKEFGKKGINNFFYRFVFKNTKSVLLSPRLYSDIENYVHESNVYYCPNGIENSPNLNIEASNHAAQNKVCQFLFLSNMMIEKGVLELLNACQLLKLRNLPFECHFIGAWSDISEDFFEQTVSDLGISKHVFAHGKKYNDDKLEFFSKADVFVFPTYYHNETFGLVILEAMQAGLPVISTNEGGIPDVVIDGVTGILVQQKNAIMLADKMEFLIISPKTRKKMGIAGKNRYLKLFQLQTFENCMVNLLEDAIGK